MSDILATTYPALGNYLPKVAVANLPTPVSAHEVSLPAGTFDVFVKHDELTSDLYGGNKVRKLEYLLQRAKQRGARRVATFGAAGSNHALATAIHARALDLDCTCFLAHQKISATVPRTLNMHRYLETEIVPWKHDNRLNLYREYLQFRDTWVVPLGGTCWLGSVGFVAAGLELAQQVADGALQEPERIYIACGTTGSTAGLAIGLAAAGLDTVVHAVQVADNPFASEEKLHKLMAKTRYLLNRIDPRFELQNSRDRIVWRRDFLAGGYARVDSATTNARAIAEEQLNLALDTTYTSKALAAMLHDLQAPEYGNGPYLFWNTYNAQPLPVDSNMPDSFDTIPEEFARYYS